MNRRTSSQEATLFVPNPFLRFDRKEGITLLLPRSEMGQGAAGGWRILAAEELRVSPDKIEVAFAPAAPEYVNPMLGAQITGGSTSVRGAWKPLRQAAAQAREALVATAAAMWQVDRADCETEQGVVTHRPTGRHLTYAELVPHAASRPPPEPPPLTPRDQFRVIGRRHPPPFLRDKLEGRCRYGVDVRLPGMCTAVVARCPVPGGKAEGFDPARALAVPGVRRVLPIDSGIAVVADGLWAARQGRERLTVSWDEGALARLDTAALGRAFAQAQGEATVKAERVLEAVYDTPYLAHAPLEPMNCTVRLAERGCEIWVPTQDQSGVVETARSLTGLPERLITVHTTFLGGGFGRRLESDFVAEAIQIAQQMPAPVQLAWTLDDDFAHDFYRPANRNVLQGGLDARGEPVAWHQRTIGPALALGEVSVPYDIADRRLEKREVDPGLPTGAWRSVGASQNAFAVESFVDELAHAAGEDPFDFRWKLLRNAPRHRRVLERAAELGEWGRPLPDGHGRGIAVYHSYGSWVAEVARVAVEGSTFRVERMAVAVDCGTAIDPEGIEAQMEGAVAFGLSAALRERITVAHGRVRETDFGAYPLLRFSEMPEVVVAIVESDAAPGGVGEPGVPPVAPAVANALFAASGVRVRGLPLTAYFTPPDTLKG